MTEQTPAESSALFEELVALADRHIRPGVPDDDRVFGIIMLFAATLKLVGQRAGFGPRDLANIVFQVASGPSNAEPDSTSHDDEEGDQAP